MGTDTGAATGGEQQASGETQQQGQAQGQQVEGGESLEAALGTQQQAAAAEKWFYADGVEGKDKAPDWFDGKKYKSVAEQAKAYPELSKKLGEMSTKLKGFTGAPEGDYQLSLPEGVQGEIDTDNPLLADFKSWAKEAGLSQEKFTELLHVYAKNEAYQGSIEPLKAALGDKANDRIQSMIAWGKANLDADQYKLLNSSALNPVVFQLVEGLIAKIVQPAARLGDDVQSSAGSVEALDREYRTPDPTTRRARIETPEGLAEYRTKLAEIVGTGQHQIITGSKPRAVA